jgi:hypothetical protein
MTLTKRVQRLLIALFCAVLLVVYAIAWLAPAIGLLYDDAIFLVSAKTIVSEHGNLAGRLPTPLFPALLALFTLVSDQAPWLKLLPLLCTLAWLYLTQKLFIKMGASANGALMIAALTAAAPAVVSFSTSLLPESLFALLVTAAILAMLEDRALLAGIFAGMAAITLTPGIALIAACLLTLAVRGRFRSSIAFTAAAMAIVAPVFGWALAHGPHAGFVLRASEKLVVLGRNAVWLTEAPFAAISGVESIYAATVTLILLGWALIKRRQFVPDLFIFLYCLMLLVRVSPPARMVAPILPFVLWILWRGFQNLKIQEAFAAGVLLLAAIPLSIDLGRLPSTLRNGQFPVSAAQPDDWNQMRKLFTHIRFVTAPGAVILANLDPVFSLNTGRRAMRGFTSDPYQSFYAPPHSIVTPDAISTGIMTNGIEYVVLTPDRGFVESASFHKAVEALERGGLLEPVAAPDLAPGYRLLRTASFKFRQ